MTKTILSALGLTALIFCLSLLPRGQRELGTIENIHGILYPELVEGHTRARLITESLAHADIYLEEPVLAKQLELTLTYRPINLTTLAVGVREDSFWLSYGERQEIYRQVDSPVSVTDGNSPGVSTVQLTVPLTDKLQETDRSLDLMFFAEGDTPLWELHDLKANVTYARPTYRQFRNYVGSVLKRERAL